MPILSPIATSAAQAVNEPFGYANRATQAQPIAAKILAEKLPADVSAEDRDRYESAVRVTHVSAWAPGKWKSRDAVAERWASAIDDHWAEPLALTDGSWRLHIGYYQAKAPLVSQLTDEDRDKLAELAARPLGPKRPKPQQGLDFGLFAQLTGISPDALTPGTFEVPDPLNPGRTLPDE